MDLELFNHPHIFDNNFTPLMSQLFIYSICVWVAYQFSYQTSLQQMD